MRDIFPTSQFKKDFKKYNRLDIIISSGWIETFYCILNKKPMSEARKDHFMKGEWLGCKNCHIKPDLVLIYGELEGQIILYRLGTHSELKIA